MAQMILHQGAAHGAQRLLRGRNLHEDVGAVAIFFHQALQTAHLPFNPAQAFQVGRLDFRIDGQRLAALLVRAAAAGCRAVESFRVFLADMRSPPIFLALLLYYTPSPYVNRLRTRHAASQSQTTMLPNHGEIWTCLGSSCCYNALMTLMEITYELQSRLQPEQLRALGSFANTYGLRRFRVDEQANRLSFEYDASRLKETEVEHVLRQAKIPVLRRVDPVGTVSQI